MKKTFKSEYIYEKTWKMAEKIETLKRFRSYKKVEDIGYYGRMTDAQYSALKSGNLKKYRKMIDNAIVRETAKLESKKAEFSANCEEFKRNGKLLNLSISVSWTVSRTWGYIPHAEVRAEYEHEVYRAEGTASGCGYDKESAAVASALNEIMYPFFMRNYKKFADLKTYGVCQSWLSFEGGVGMSSFTRAFKDLGYDVIEYHGKMSDFYTITLKRGKR